jgi:hypothetical protein
MMSVASGGSDHAQKERTKRKKREKERKAN